MSNGTDIALSAGLPIPQGAKVTGRRFAGGIGIEFTFPNGWGASVVRNQMSYGNASGLFELAVLRDGKINYENPLTSDVIGWLEPDEVDEHLKTIAGWATASLPA